MATISDRVMMLSVGSICFGIGMAIAAYGCAIIRREATGDSEVSDDSDDSEVSGDARRSRRFLINMHNACDANGDGFNFRIARSEEGVHVLYAQERPPHHPYGNPPPPYQEGRNPRRPSRPAPAQPGPEEAPPVPPPSTRPPSTRPPPLPPRPEGPGGEGSNSQQPA